MRIRSNYKDYYDCHAAHSQEDFLWERNAGSVIHTTAKEIIRLAGHIPYGNIGLNSYFYEEYCYLFYCGRVVPFILVKDPLRQLTTSWLYNAKDVTKFYEGVVRRVKPGWFTERMLQQRIKEVSKWIEEERSEWTSTDKVFAGQYSPIFLTTHFRWRYARDYNEIVEVEVNPCLKSIDFFRIVDSYTAYQDIRMWMSNLAAPVEFIPQISDADMLEAKGFNPRFSFRQAGPGKKRNRKKYKNG